MWSLKRVPEVPSKEWWHQRYPWFHPWNFTNFSSYNSTKHSLINTQTYLKDLLIETSKVGQSGSELERQEERKSEMSQRCSSAAGSLQWGSAWGEEELDCGWHSLQLGGVKRFSEHACWSGLYKLWLRPETWASTENLATMVCISNGETKSWNLATL